MADENYDHTTYVAVKADIDYVDQEDDKLWTAIDEIGGKKMYALQMDEEAGSITYIGEAEIGSETTSAVWRIKRLDESGDPELIIKWADGDEEFNNIWDDRTTLIYA